MKPLTNKEEEVMKILWSIKKGFVKDIFGCISGWGRAAPLQHLVYYGAKSRRKGLCEPQCLWKNT